MRYGVRWPISVKFINAAGPVPLPVTLVMDIDTLDCNELARVYVAGLRAARGEKAVEALAGPQPLTASDTIAMLLPRNVRGRCEDIGRQTPIS